MSQMRKSSFQETKKKRERLKSDGRQKAQRSWRENSTKHYTFRTEIGVGAACVGLERQHHADGQAPKARRRKRTRFHEWY